MSLIRSVRIAVLISAGCAAAEPPIGIVKTVRGEAAIVRTTGTVVCKERMNVQAGDRIRTKSGASAGVILLDGTRISVGENSDVAIEQYLFEPSESRFGLAVQVFRGILAYISGRIGRLSPDAVSIQTPTGIVGTRGTALAVRIEAAP